MSQYLAEVKPKFFKTEARRNENHQPLISTESQKNETSSLNVSSSADSTNSHELAYKFIPNGNYQSEASQEKKL